MIDKSLLEEPFDLSEADKMNPLWLRMEPYLAKRLSKLRAQNDADLDPEETAKLRGKISELKTMLNLAKAKPIV